MICCQFFKDRIKFQYISCYSLSVKETVIQYAGNSFNTSHVTLYLAGIPEVEADENRFNTSHVTLYRSDVHRYMRL